ncbi:DUF523 domain-containing protein [Thalassotalea sp. PLHSN55]|uniref:DUF523 domain-containing protein n=1 Tax=Thalassotalea sp. PLHSN55 TaxID=3435888 RepID=UPI003F86F793
MEKILISSCFLGARVRYNAELKPLLHPLIDKWQKEGRFVAICPEVSGGLPTPRAPAEMQPQSQLIFTNKGEDVTAYFNQGAQLALDLCRQHHIRFALLKESSPSCGSGKIYDGSFSQKKIAGQGVTSALLLKHGIEVFSEETIEELSRQLSKQALD